MDIVSAYGLYPKIISQNTKAWQQDPILFRAVILHLNVISITEDFPELQSESLSFKIITSQQIPGKLALKIPRQAY